MSARVEQHAATAHVYGLALTVDATCAVITCDHDGCGAVYAHEGDALDVADAEARALGWTSVHERDGCQAHPVAGDDAAPDAARERGR